MNILPPTRHQIYAAIIPQNLSKDNKSNIGAKLGMTNTYLQTTDTYKFIFFPISKGKIIII